MKARRIVDVTSELANAVSEYGFPIIAAMGLGYFVYYVWRWVTLEVKPTLLEANTTLIKLVDRIRMLDNDMIRLNTKLAMVLEHRSKLSRENQSELQEIVDRNLSQTETFNSTGKSNGKDTD